MAQPGVQLQQTEIQFWLDKVECWGEADACKDACFHLSTLRDFLQRLLTHITNMGSTTETMKNMPSLGQLVGRLCWNPVVTAHDETRALIFQCLWGLHTEQPANALERKANQWIQMVAQLQENTGKPCSLLGGANQRCSCSRIAACIPLVTCPEVAPLIGALLQRPLICAESALTDSFHGAISSAYSSGRLSLEDQAVVTLWYRNLPSLEEAVLSLLESTVLGIPGTSLQQLQQQIAQSLLPKACAQHCAIFLVANDIFRFLLKKREANPGIRILIQMFTSRFYQELTLLHPRARLPLKAFFPLSPKNLLLPLLTQPSEVPGEARRRHLNWLSGSLRRLTEEEEEAGASRSIFEAWFLLVQCSHWVQAALQLLVTTELPDLHPLLWLLTFYHHPTKRGHCRDVQLVHLTEARDHLHHLFVSAPPPAHQPPLPVERLHSLLALISPGTRRPSAAPLLIVDLVVNFAVFSQQSLRVSAEIVHTVAAQAGLASEAVHVLDSLGHRLSAASSPSSEADRASIRIKELHNTLRDLPADSRPLL
uniref:Fanconi anemia group C protein isoform X2 n=1 Tax=Doryrhamphus excisus TaxID=161450 RepID=UPI0025AE66AF|nr:Fanconi anemia group C protein isoform X2 [Doryrhamphus excisus]